VSGEAREARTGKRDEIGLASRSEVAYRRVNASASRRDLHVSETGRAELMLLVPGTAEDRMRVRVDEAGGEYAAGTVDALRIGVVVLQFGRRTQRHDAVITRRDRGIREDGDVRHLDPAASARGAGARDNLSRADEQPVHGSYAITSRTRESRRGAWASPRHA
jgi:hypothetical protein